MDVALEILILANAVIVAVTFVFFGPSLLHLVKVNVQANFRFNIGRFKIRRRYAIALGLAAITVTSVYGVTLFQHNFPATPVGTQRTIYSTCTNLVLATSGMVTSLPASMLFNCGPTAPAITANSDGSSTPTFTLPNSATSLSLVSHVNNVSVCTGGTTLTSGTAHTFALGDSLDYCLTSNSYPNGGIPGFTVTWSQ